jgi:hypothetical protein
MAWNGVYLIFVVILFVLLFFGTELTSSSGRLGKGKDGEKRKEGTYNSFHQLVCFVDVVSQSRWQRSDGEY